MTIKNQSSQKIVHTSKKPADLGLVGAVSGATGQSAIQKQDATKLAEFVSVLGEAVPDFETLLSNMRLAAQMGVTLPKALRVYLREDGDYGVISSKASLTDKQKFAKSCAYRKRYTFASEDLLFAAFGIWDFQTQDSKGAWVNPSWTNTPTERRLRTLAWIKSAAHCADEVSSFGA